MIPFASVLGGLAGSAILQLLNWLSLKFYGGFSPDGWMMLYVLPIMSCAAFGFIYTWIACSMAPRAKFITGVVMISVLGVVSVTCIIVFWWSPAFSVGRAIFETLKAIAWMVAAMVAFSDFYDK